MCDRARIIVLNTDYPLALTLSFTNGMLVIPVIIIQQRHHPAFEVAFAERNHHPLDFVDRGNHRVQRAIDPIDNPTEVALMARGVCTRLKPPFERSLRLCFVRM